jgi:hypothetical protein
VILINAAVALARLQTSLHETRESIGFPSIVHDQRLRERLAPFSTAEVQFLGTGDELHPSEIYLLLTNRLFDFARSRFKQKQGASQQRVA